jgi:adenylate cyclase
MVASGVPKERPDHAVAAAELALELREALRAYEDPLRRPLKIRIGMHSGPVVAGVFILFSR